MPVALPPNLEFALRPATAWCVLSAARRFALPPEALLAMLFTEGGERGTASHNQNGTIDLGPLQTNTVWLDPHSSLYGYVTFDRLRDDVCVNLHAAAWIVESYVKRDGDDIWSAIGRYHAPHNAALARRYQERVNRRLPQARAVLRMAPAYRRYELVLYRLPQDALR